MTDKARNDLKSRIEDELTVERLTVLQKNFELAKRFIRVTKDGTVDVLIKDQIVGEEIILLYLVGKLYAKEAGYAKSYSVNNKELANELGIPEGSLRPWLMNLRKKPGIRKTMEGKEVAHYLPVNLVEPVLKGIKNKVDKTS